MFDQIEAIQVEDVHMRPPCNEHHGRQREPIADAPCDTCINAWKCDHFEIACEDFAFYVKHGYDPQRGRNPNAVTYNKIYKRGR